MKQLSYISFLFGLFLFGYVLSINTGYTSFNGCSLYGQTSGVFSFDRPLGESRLCITQTFDAIVGHNLQRCSDIQPVTRVNNIYSDRDSPFSDSGNSCYECGSASARYAGDGCRRNRWNILYDENGNRIGTECREPLEPYYTWTRSCSLRPGIAASDTIVNGQWSHPLKDKYNQCYGTRNIPTSNARLVVTQSFRNGPYLWDDVAPRCVPAANISTDNIHTLGGRYRDDIELYQNNTAYIEQATSIRTSIVYNDNRNQSYDGSWTNTDLVPQSGCIDEHSGCRETNTRTHNILLSHLQATYPFVYRDNANNPSDGVCRSLVVAPERIGRSCEYTLNETTLRQYQNNNQHHIGTADRPRIDTIIGNIANSQFYPEDVSHLLRIHYRVLTSRLLGRTDITPTRRAQLLEARSFFDSVTRWDMGAGGTESARYIRIITGSNSPSIGSSAPLVRDDASCQYYPLYPDDATITASGRPPLIDKIRPTIYLGLTLGGHSEVLTHQEQNIINNQRQSFFAGESTISLTLLDTDTRSTYVPNTLISERARYAGISGIYRYSLVIERTETGTGGVLSSPEVVTSIYHQASTPYNPLGAISTPHTLALQRNMTIDQTGVYRIRVVVQDFAGNINNTQHIFAVVPRNININDGNPCDLPNPPAYCATIDEDNICQPHLISLIKLRTDTPRDCSSLNRGANDSIVYTITRLTAREQTLYGTQSGSEDSYADFDSENIYILRLVDMYGNPISGMTFDNFSLSSTGIYLDAISESGESALWVDVGLGYSNQPQSITTDNEGSVLVRMRSLVPGQYNEQFRFRIRSWDRFGVQVPTSEYFQFPGSPRQGQFYHIFTGAIDLYITDRIDIGTHNDARVALFPTRASAPRITSITVQDFIQSTRSDIPDRFQVFSYRPDQERNIERVYPDSGQVLYVATGAFTAEQVGTGFVDTLSIVATPYVRLGFRGIPATSTIREARYRIGDTRDDYRGGLTFGSGVTNRIYVEGNQQSIGREGYVQSSNTFTNINSSGFANMVRKNAALFTRNIRSGDSTVNNVRFVQSNDFRLSSNDLSSDWDTLIVKGGNIILDGNINIGGERQIALVALKDEEDNGGYIYVTPSVEYIGATMFAEESIMSTNSSGELYRISDSTRARDLANQLIVYGGIYSKNTIGGAVRGDSNGQYILPWKNTTTTLDEAILYDLSFMRMGNNNTIGSLLSRGRQEFVIIFIDQRNITNPLPIWQNNLGQ